MGERERRSAGAHARTGTAVGLFFSETFWAIVGHWLGRQANGPWRLRLQPTDMIGRAARRRKGHVSVGWVGGRSGVWRGILGLGGVSRQGLEIHRRCAPRNDRVCWIRNDNGGDSHPRDGRGRGRPFDFPQGERGGWWGALEIPQGERGGMVWWPLDVLQGRDLRFLVAALLGMTGCWGLGMTIVPGLAGGWGVCAGFHY